MDLNELKCTVCFETFRKPTTLSCGHSFCYDCISSVRASKKALCPICRCPISGTLKPNITLQNLLSMYSRKEYREISVKDVYYQDNVQTTNRYLIFRGEHDNVQVLVKKFTTDSEEWGMDFREQLPIISGLNHPRLSQFIAASAREPPYALIYLYYPITLRNHIQDREPLIQERVFDILQQVCEGLQYLHSQAIIHGRLHAGNIYLDPRDGGIRIGMHCLQMIESINSNGKLVEDLDEARYLAPEVLLNNSGVDLRADIYSFGLLIFETLAREHPFHYLTTMEALTSAVAIRKQRPPLTPYLKNNCLSLLMVHCWEQQANARPNSAKALRAQLQQEIESYNKKPESYAFDATTVKTEADKALQRAKELYDINRYPDSEKEADRAIKLDPARAEGYLVRSRALLCQRSFREAYHSAAQGQKVFQKNQGKSSDDEDPSKTEAELAKILREAEILEKQRHTHIQKLREESRQALALGKNHDALELITQAVSLSCDSIDVLIDRSNVFFLLGEYERAWEDANAAAALRPGYAPAYFMFAKLHYAAKDFKKAIDELNKAMALHPNNQDYRELEKEIRQKIESDNLNTAVQTGLWVGVGLAVVVGIAKTISSR